MGKEVVEVFLWLIVAAVGVYAIAHAKDFAQATTSLLGFPEYETTLLATGAAPAGKAA